MNSKNNSVLEENFRDWFKTLDKDNAIDINVIKRLSAGLKNVDKSIRITLDPRAERQNTLDKIYDRIEISHDDYPKIESLIEHVLKESTLSHFSPYGLLNLLIILERIEWNTVSENNLKNKFWSKLESTQKKQIIEILIPFFNSLDFKNHYPTPEPSNIKDWQSLFRNMTRTASTSGLTRLLSYLISSYYSDPYTEKNVNFITAINPIIRSILFGEAILNSFHSEDIYDLLAKDEKNLPFLFAYILSEDVLFTGSKAEYVFKDLEKSIIQNSPFRTELSIHIFNSYRKIEPRNDLVKRTLQIVTKEAARSIDEKKLFNDFKLLLSKPSDFIFVSRLYDYSRDFRIQFNEKYFHNQLVENFFNSLLNSSKSIPGNLSSYFKFDYLFPDNKNYSVQTLCAHLLLGLVKCDDNTFKNIDEAIIRTLENIRPLLFGDFEATTTGIKYIHILMQTLLSAPLLENIILNEVKDVIRIDKIFKNIDRAMFTTYMQSLASNTMGFKDSNPAFMSDEIFIMQMMANENQPKHVRSIVKRGLELFPISWPEPLQIILV